MSEELNEMIKNVQEKLNSNQDQSLTDLKEKLFEIFPGMRVISSFLKTENDVLLATMSCLNGYQECRKDGGKNAATKLLLANHLSSKILLNEFNEFRKKME